MFYANLDHMTRLWSKILFCWILDIQRPVDIRFRLVWPKLWMSKGWRHRFCSLLELLKNPKLGMWVLMRALFRLIPIVVCSKGVSPRNFQIFAKQRSYGTQFTTDHVRKLVWYVSGLLWEDKSIACTRGIIREWGEANIFHKSSNSICNDGKWFLSISLLFRTFCSPFLMCFIQIHVSVR